MGDLTWYAQRLYPYDSHKIEYAVTFPTKGKKYK